MKSHLILFSNSILVLQVVIFPNQNSVCIPCLLGAICLSYHNPNHIKCTALIIIIKSSIFYIFSLSYVHLFSIACMLRYFLRVADHVLQPHSIELRVVMASSFNIAKTYINVDSINCIWLLYNFVPCGTKHTLFIFISRLSSNVNSVPSFQHVRMKCCCNGSTLF